MKKALVSLVLALLVGVAVAPAADAQILVCGYCCSSNGTPVCSGIELPCGSSCRCYGVPGYGFAC